MTTNAFPLNAKMPTPPIGLFRGSRTLDRLTRTGAALRLGLRSNPRRTFRRAVRRSPAFVKCGTRRTEDITRVWASRTTCSGNDVRP